MTALRLERRSRTAQSNCTQGYVARFPKNYLLLGNWNVLTLTGKELELVEEAKKYTKRRGSRIVDLDDGWKLFYLGADPRMSAQAGVEILTSPQLVDCVFDRILLESRACMLELKVKDLSLCLLQVYAPNAVSEYQGFVDNVNNALQRVRSREYTIILRNFNARIGTDGETWKGVLVRMETEHLARTAGLYCSFVVAKGSAL